MPSKNELTADQVREAVADLRSRRETINQEIEAKKAKARELSKAIVELESKIHGSRRRKTGNFMVSIEPAMLKLVRRS